MSSRSRGFCHLAFSSSFICSVCLSYLTSLENRVFVLALCLISWVVLAILLTSWLSEEKLRWSMTRGSFPEINGPFSFFGPSGNYIMLGCRDPVYKVHGLIERQTALKPGRCGFESQLCSCYDCEGLLSLSLNLLYYTRGRVGNNTDFQAWHEHGRVGMRHSWNLYNGRTNRIVTCIYKCMLMISFALIFNVLSHVWWLHIPPWDIKTLNWGHGKLIQEGMCSVS